MLNVKKMSGLVPSRNLAKCFSAVETLLVTFLDLLKETAKEKQFLALSVMLITSDVQRVLFNFRRGIESGRACHSSLQ